MRFFYLPILILLASCAQKSPYLLVVGTYTDAGSKGVYTYAFDGTSGESAPLSMVEVENPSFLTFAPHSDLIYAVSENDTIYSRVNTLSLETKTGKMELLNRRDALGAWPCHIAYDSDKNLVVAANYGGGSLSLFSTDERGELTDMLQYIALPMAAEKGSHAHSTLFSPDGAFLFVADLGDDKLFRFNIVNGERGFLLDEASRIATDLPKGTGPRHFVFDAAGRYLYLLGELSGNVHTFAYHKGNLTEIHTTPTAAIAAGGSADIHLSPDGRFLYTSNRLKEDGIAIFRVDPVSGIPTKVGEQRTGVHPRNFGITPNGKFLVVACRDSNLVEVYEIQSDGLLKDTNHSIALSKPVFIAFLPR